jgi:oligoribonuclease (3'-5' exoribonuclease)
VNEQRKAGKKQLTPQSSSRKRRTLPGPPEDRISGVKSHRSKKKLNFETTTEQPTERRTNILNLPYTDSEPEQEDESPVIKSPEHSIEFAQNYETFTHTEEGETSKSTKSKKTQKIKHLKEVIAQQEVLERVIKERYKKLSDNFAETNAAFEKLARESVKEKKRKQKITKDYNSLWWLAKRLKRKIRKLKQKKKSHPDLQVLAQVVVNMQGDKAETH